MEPQTNKLTQEFAAENDKLVENMQRLPPIFLRIHISFWNWGYNTGNIYIEANLALSKYLNMEHLQMF